MKSQIELAKEKGIEVGDRVKVERKYEGDEWSDSWTGGMDKYIGHEILVDEIKDCGLYNETSGYYFPVQSLEKVEEVTLPEVPSWDADRVHISVHMTKREYFAAMAMQGLIGANCNDVAIAVRYADALIAELNKGEGV